MALEQPPKRKRLIPKSKVAENAIGGKLPQKGQADDCDTIESPPTKKAKAPKVKKDKSVEKRLRKYRDYAPKTYTDRLERALSQRFVLSPTFIGPR